MKFRPLQDRVLIRRLDSEEKTAGGIIIPDTAKEKPMEGVVVAVGPGARSEGPRRMTWHDIGRRPSRRARKSALADLRTKDADLG